MFAPEDLRVSGKAKSIAELLQQAEVPLVHLDLGPEDGQVNGSTANPLLSECTLSMYAEAGLAHLARGEDMTEMAGVQGV